MNSLTRRLLAAFGATSFGRITTTLIQIVSVPVFLSHWGAGLYGEWILLNAIPSYFSMSDLGFGTVAGNEMTMLMATGKQAEALEIFQSVWVITTCVPAAAAMLLLVAVWFLPFGRWMHLHLISPLDASLIAIFLVFSVLFGLQESLFQAAFRSEEKYAYGTTMKSLLVLASFVATLISVLIGFSPKWVALTYLCANALGTIILWILLRRQIPWIRFGVEFARWSTIRRLASPAISLMYFPIANALSMQGILMLIGHVVGPVSVVVFNTARTISRSAYQIMNLINNSVWPEISSAFGAGNLDLARRLHRRACQMSIVLCLGMSVLVALLGSRIWRLWTVGKVATDPVLLNLMMLQLLVSSLWFTSSVVPLAINKHQGLARVILCSSVLSLAVSWLLLTQTGLGLRGVAAGLVIADVLNATYVLRTSLHLLDDSLEGFCRNMLTLPKLGFQRRLVNTKA